MSFPVDSSNIADDDNDNINDIGDVDGEDVDNDDINEAGALAKQVFGLMTPTTLTTTTTSTTTMTTTTTTTTTTKTATTHKRGAITSARCN